MLEKRSQLPREHDVDPDKFIYCLEGVPDVAANQITEVQKSLEELALQFGVASIYQTCDTIEGLETSLNILILDDHYFKEYEIIYLVMTGEANSICLNDYYYSLQEIAELFEGKLRGKIVHFSNAKVLDLDGEEAQYFLDITNARALSGYGNAIDGLSSSNLDKVFFHLFNEDDDLFQVVEELHQKHYTACKVLDFRMYY
ncbi:hypothetical protein DSM03_102529 [Leeuwenhoekiella aestuarii]|uniref:Uncharacterized protein n=1 Tax=Leeuwenhoekiella aestuarii TaxID=2249426 RepID=A0A4Q0NUP5_9FLAO|nr:DUF6642 family protein [Leeuwenhoekiella aestuarii]RXG15238.1 hypothetical protein DSM04_103126 [Leeuwenhoekiella aestuarii]RXG17652.1 hypothetical protein DSM03_102529 [Leeuwenhoekiella aestuarii]